MGNSVECVVSANMYRMLMGLDIGDERTGVAFADQEVGIPHAHSTLNKTVAESQILALITERSVDTVVVGLPLNDDGSEGPQCLKVRAVVKRLVKRTQAKFIFVDEYGSSVEAIEVLRQSGRRIRDKGDVDSASAAIILQRYLDSEGTS